MRLQMMNIYGKVFFIFTQKKILKGNNCVPIFYEGKVNYLKLGKNNINFVKYISHTKYLHFW